MPSDPLNALREAATVLLAEAPLPVVKTTLRALLNGADTEPRGAQPPATARESTASPPPKRTQPQPKATAAHKPTQSQDDTAWDARRKAIRAAMLEREIGYAELAQEFRVAVKVLHHALGRRQPPSGALRQRLEKWLATAAPAVAAEPPFRPNGTGRLHPNADGAAERTAAG